MASEIDPRFPVFARPMTDTVRANFQHAKDEIEALQRDKADLESPAFAGDVRVPDPPVGSDDNRAANTRFVRAAVAGLEDIDGGSY